MCFQHFLLIRFQLDNIKKHFAFMKARFSTLPSKQEAMWIYVCNTTPTLNHHYGNITLFAGDPFLRSLATTTTKKSRTQKGY